MRFREQRGILDDSMKTLVELKDRNALVEHCKKIYQRAHLGDGTLDPERLKVKLYNNGRPDDRIGWEKVYIVVEADEKGNTVGIPYGFTDCPADA